MSTAVGVLVRRVRCESLTFVTQISQHSQQPAGSLTETILLPFGDFRLGPGPDGLGPSGSLVMGVAILANVEYAASSSTSPGGLPMSRRQKDPLRKLTDQERVWLVRISRSQAEPAAHVARAKALLAVADGNSYTDAARAAGRRSGEAVSHLVSRFNREGIAALEPRHGGGPVTIYADAERERILAEARRVPERDRDGTATWSLTTLRRALREAPDGLPTGCRR